MLYVSRQPQPCINTGDIATDPTRYFDFGEVRHVSFDEDIPQGAKLLITGGGIIMSEEVCQRLHRQIAAASKAVLWGPGLQYPYARDRARYPDWVDGPRGWLLPEHHRKVLFGLRDAGTGVPWVPCVSCMHPYFDDPPRPTRPFSLYYGSRIFPGHGHPALRNNANLPIETVLDHLADGETIVTSSYHGLLWGCFLGRRVILLPAMANAKFFHWPFTHVRLQDHVDWRTVDFVPRCAGALEQCRARTRRFEQQASHFLSA